MKRQRLHKKGELGGKTARVSFSGRKSATYSEGLSGVRLPESDFTHHKITPPIIMLISLFCLVSDKYL